mmetsp:Transcript_32061/g.58742  ORF Transcript_32061/g.58742 Transcript_32061/m.58742 type:complete len:94 (+) Transcript_32061:2098-2379(+)
MGLSNKIGNSPLSLSLFETPLNLGRWKRGTLGEKLCKEKTHIIADAANYSAASYFYRIASTGNPPTPNRNFEFHSHTKKKQHARALTRNKIRT